MVIYERPMSPSSINTYLDCGYKWYLRYARGIRIESGEPAQFGTAIHLVNEKFWGNYRNQPDPLLAMQETINAHWDKTIGEEYEIPTRDCIGNFLSIVGENPTLFPLHTEFKALNTDNNTVAIIDVVYPNKICDYKTSKQYTVKPKENNIIQAVMCSENLKFCTGLEVRNIEFWYLRFKKYQYVDVTPVLVEEINTLIEDIKSKILNDIFPKSPKACFFCDYKLICKAEQKALDKQIKRKTGQQTLF